MTQGKHPERTDPFSSDRREEEVERVDRIALSSLHVGDRIGMAFANPIKKDLPSSIVLQVKEVGEGEEGIPLVTFIFSPFFGPDAQAFGGADGVPVAPPEDSTLQSGFSSWNSRIWEGHEPSLQNYAHIERYRSYWFQNAGEPGKVAIAAHIQSLVILRAL